MAIDWEAALDPSEVLDFEMDFGGGPDPVLEAGEEIASYTLAVTAEAALLGLEIKSGGGYDPALSVGNRSIILWLQVDPLKASDPAFDDEGTALGVVATVVTDATPARTRQRTFNVTVKQQ